MWTGAGRALPLDRSKWSLSESKRERRGGELMEDTEDKVGATEGSRNSVLWRELILGPGL